LIGLTDFFGRLARLCGWSLGRGAGGHGMTTGGCEAVGCSESVADGSGPAMEIVVVSCEAVDGLDSVADNCEESCLGSTNGPITESNVSTIGSACIGQIKVAAST
jgi:hypothetical protein